MTKPNFHEEREDDVDQAASDAADHHSDEPPCWAPPPTPVIETLIQPFNMWDDNPFEEMEWNVTRIEAEELLSNGGFAHAVESSISESSTKRTSRSQ